MNARGHKMALYLVNHMFLKRLVISEIFSST